MPGDFGARCFFVRKLNWYKRDPVRAIKGMMGLTLEEKGAYNTLIDLIYIYGGKVRDNSEFLCGNMECDPRVWKRIKLRLIEARKIYIENDFIHDFTADEITNSYQTRGSATPLGTPQPQPSQTPSLIPVSFENKDMTPTEKKREEQNRIESKKEEEEIAGLQGFTEREFQQYRKQCPTLDEREFRNQLHNCGQWILVHGAKTPEVTLSKWLQREEKTALGKKPKKSSRTQAEAEALQRELRGLPPQ